MKQSERIKISLAFMIVVGIFIIMSSNIVSANLGSFIKDSCVNIRVLANCSNINITEVTDGNTTFLINLPMTNLGGQTFNYSFCNTSKIATYSYSWNNPCIDCSNGDCGNTFDITSTGEKVSLSNIILVLAFLIIAGVLFAIGITFDKNKWMVKSFFFIFSLLMLLISLNSARIIASESLNLGTMANIGLIALITIISFMVLYIMILWTIDTIKSVKEKKGVRWQY